MAELPIGSVQNGKDQIPPLDFSKVVEQSKINLINSEPPKTRGRKPLPRDANGNIIRASGATGPELASVPRPSIAVAAPPPDISPYLITPLQGLSRIPAARFGIPEIALTADEAGACASSLNQLMNVFVPSFGEMSPKTAAIFSAAVTFGTIGFSKYQIYLIKTAHPKTEVIQEKIETPTPSPVDAPAFPTVVAGAAAPAANAVAASEYFARKAN